MAADPSLLERALSYRFRNPALLRQALTHRSHSLPHNERLEFLGDSVLNAVVARLLFDTFPARPEGELSRLRASLVKKEMLAELAVALRVGEYLHLGEGELRSGGAQRPSILADALEALIAAIYLDADYVAAENVVRGLLMPHLNRLDPEVAGKDSKTILQECLQAGRHPLPVYLILEQQGEAHDQHFIVACEVPSLDIQTRGEGPSRRVAEQRAATAALLQLQPHSKGR